MRILFVMDPIRKLYKTWDSSLALLQEMAARGHENWTADIPDIWAESRNVFAHATRLEVHPSRSKRPARLIESGSVARPLTQFDLLLIRKNPPFDESYLGLTYLLERVADKVPMVNHPRGIRNTSEKVGTLLFPKWIPETIVTSSPEKILAFQHRINKDLVIKPIGQKGGHGVFLLKRSDRNRKGRMEKATQQGKKIVLAQRSLLQKSGRRREKRILILDGKILAAYEKRPREREFRANLGLGGTFHTTQVSPAERKLVKAMAPYLLKEGLRFVGIDTLEDKLIDFNVTSPAGIVESKILYPSLEPAKAWADSLEILGLGPRI